MAKSNSFETLIHRVRLIASEGLASHNKSNASIQEQYLLANERFAGIRYQCGPFQMLWKCNEPFVTLSRGTLTIDQIHLDEQDNARRAA